MIKQTYRKKLDSEGKPLIENGDFVMELVEEKEMPSEPIEPNWLGLEQDLRYANDGALFYKAYILAPDKGFAFFVATLQNGVAGRSSENALATGFQLLPIKYVNSEPVVTFGWTKEEKDIINSLLEKNNFVYRLT